MSGVLVCIPARRGDLDALRRDPVDAITANQALFETLDYTADMAEEAEYAALVLASIWALARHGERFVVTAEVAASQVVAGDEVDNGGIRVSGLRRDQLIACFDDGLARADEATAAAGAARGLSIDEAWDRAEVAALLQHELLWHTIEEGGY
ncbi:DUF6912 family protein [Propionibacteriaceae bacterium G57]|uniref:DUF6912 family protein n=1 Tax=Aestuariimicrobium sp. G57 TaxID=3418485 RepID=UPI003DA78FF0